MYVCMQLPARIAGRQQLHQPHTVSHGNWHSQSPTYIFTQKLSVSITHYTHNNTVRTAQCVLGRYRRLLTEGRVVLYVHVHVGPEVTFPNTNVKHKKLVDLFLLLLSLFKCSSIHSLFFPNDPMPNYQCFYRVA